MATDHEATAPLTYEQRLDRDRNWALREGSLHFEGASAVQLTLDKITRRLAELGIPHALAGGMALFRHGFRRFTEDVDLLVTRDGLRALHAHLDGRGYLPPFQGSKNLRDTEHGVRIEFLVTGDYPGDGKPKPVAFPDPDDVAIDLDGVRCLSIPALVELKLASGMTGGVPRYKDLADVVGLIERIGLPRELAEKLDPYVRAKYLELWDDIQQSERLDY